MFIPAGKFLPWNWVRINMSYFNDKEKIKMGILQEYNDIIKIYDDGYKKV